MAEAGYRAAGRYAGRAYWPSYLAGLVALERDQPVAALGLFAEAVVAEPESGEALLGLAVAAYRSGDLARALEAASRAHAINPGDPLAWQVLALASAGAGDRSRSEAVLARAPLSVTPAVMKSVTQRAKVLLATRQIDDGNATFGATTASDAEVPTQLMVDVTLILADDRRGHRFGFNLLDGLKSQFSIDWKRNSGTSAGTRSSDRALTEAITVSGLDYNLNIFNRSGRYYDVLARPSLTAFLGEESRVFIGETSNVAIGGVNVATLEKIEVGVSLKVTPVEIRGDGARVRIEAERGFFSDQNPGSFAEQVTIFQQRVAATADLKFGETLVLSGLSEQVVDGQSSRTPVLGDIPGVNVLFSEKSHLERKRSAIVLVTPSTPLGLITGVESNAALRELAALWSQRIAPNSSLQGTLSRLHSLPLFTRGRASDTGLPDTFAQSAFQQALSAFEAGEAI
jgi:hypothetical protein